MKNNIKVHEDIPHARFFFDIGLIIIVKGGISMIGISIVILLLVLAAAVSAL